jgi:CopG family nickel-responsive transcriptional regulator
MSEPETRQRREGVRRISVSLPESIYRQLDGLVDRRGFQSRSQAISEMIAANLAEFPHGHGDKVMAGTLTLFYNIGQGAVRKEMARLQELHIDEVISSLHVQLENHHVMEVMLMQGPASKLESIANEFIALKGVRTGKLVLVSQIMPPLHPIAGDSEN